MKPATPHAAEPATAPLTVPLAAPFRNSNLSLGSPPYAAMKQCLAVQSEAPPRTRTSVLFGRSPLHPGARRVYRGALGEVVVAHVLEQLGAGWTILNSVPITPGEPEADHVLLGPAGVFTIQIKNHSGKKIWIAGSTFLVNGDKHDYLRRSAHEATRAARSLSAVTGRPITVTPLIVVVNPISITTGRKPSRVVVLSSNNLKRWLLKRPRALSDRAVRHFSMFAEERSTWSNTPPAETQSPLASQTCLREFERLRGRVDAARHRSRLWLLILLTAIPVSVPLFVLTVFQLTGLTLHAP